MYGFFKKNNFKFWIHTIICSVCKQKYKKFPYMSTLLFYNTSPVGLCFINLRFNSPLFLNKLHIYTSLIMRDLQHINSRWQY